MWQIMLSFMFYLNIGLNLFLKAQKSSLNWWCHLLVGRYCWMRSTILSCLLTLGIKKMHALLSAHVYLVATDMRESS